MNNKYNYTNILIILTIMTFAYIYSLLYAPSIENVNDNSFTSKIARMNKSCLMNCDSDKCSEYISKTRGNQYFLSIDVNQQEYIKNCILTFWGFSHFLMYFILGFCVPSFYIEFFFIGVAFEVYEYHKYDCHDINDIYLNSIGILLGKILSPF